MISGDELTFRLGQVERQPLGFRNTSNQKKDESEKLRNHKPHMSLRQNDVRQIEGAGQQHHSHQRKPHEHLIADHLSRGPQTAEQRILVVGGPARQHNAVYTHGGHRQHEEQSDVQVRDHDFCRHRHDDIRHQNRNHDNGWGDHEHRLVRERGYPVLFPQQLDGVSQDLK